MNLPAILSAYQLGTLINSSPLHGGAMHHTFHVTTEQGEFVVKHLNQVLEQFHTLEVTEAVGSWVYWILFCLKRQNHNFKPLNTEKMIRQSLHVIDFLLENANDIAKILLN